VNQPTPDLCCPPFDPEPWDNKYITWHNKKFVKNRVRSFLHIPLNFSAVMQRNVTAIIDAGAMPGQMAVLSDENSLWGADVYLEVTKDVPGAQMATLSGDFFSRVCEGPYRNCGKWMREFESELSAQGKKCRRIFCYYTTCPRCAKIYGKNYIVLIAELA
jgi:hypothetical protein